MNFLRFLKLLAITLISLLILFISTALIIVYFYEAEVKQFLVGQINKQLVTPVSVKNIELSLIKKFPNASLEFVDVSAESVQIPDSADKNERFKEKLFTAHKIFLQFNILDIFHKKYDIKKIDIEDASLAILISKSGYDNFHFWKKTSDSTSGNFKLNLEKIVVNNVSVTYKNDFAKHLYSFIIKDSELDGKFSENQYTLNTSGNYYVDEISIENTKYLKRKSVFVEGALLVNENKKFEIQAVELRLNELAFDLKGNYVLDTKSKDKIDLFIEGKNLDIKTLLSLLPDKYRKTLNTYSSSGLFYFKTRISGEVGENSKPKISTDFGIQNGKIKEENSDLNLDKINLKGNYTNGSNRNAASSLLSVQSLSAQLGQGSVSGSFSLSNFENPYLKIVADANLNLSQVKQFFKIDTLEKCSGSLNLDIDFSGNTSHIKHFSADDFAKTKTEGNLTIEKGELKFVGAKQSFENVNASLLFNNNDIVVNECNGKIQDSDFALKGFFRNALAYFFNADEKLFIEASLTSRLVNLNQILADDESSTKNKKAFQLKFSDRINFKLNVDVRSLIFKKFEATNLKGSTSLQDKKLALSPVSFSTMDGTVLANGIIDGSSDLGFKTLCEADLRNITMSKLFYSFENFGGTTLTDKNIKGKASATVQYAEDFSLELVTNTESIVAHIDLNIENGELINFEPTKKLSRFISLSELNDIRFASLKNNIEIKNRKITIPKMEINSSALNLSVSGTHSFDNFVDYHFKVLLSELLGKKARKAKAENEDFGLVEDDGLGLTKTAIYISMLGPLDNPKISYDRSGLKMQMKQNVSSETQNLKSILKSEFGWFKKDSTIKAPAVKKQNAKFETETEEANSKTTKSKEKELPKVKAPENMDDSKPKIKVLDKLLKNKEEEPKKKKAKVEKQENSDDFN